MKPRNYEIPGKPTRSNSPDSGELDDPSLHGDHEGYGRDPEAGQDFARVGQEASKDAALWASEERLAGVSDDVKGERTGSYEPSPEEAARLARLGVKRFMQPDAENDTTGNNEE